MKKVFFEFYETDKTELKEIWENCIFSFDANVLLNFYRYTDPTRTKFFEVLKKIKKNSVLTHQAGYEYHRNRLNTINSQQKAYDNLTEFFAKKVNEIKNELNNYKKHSYIEIDDILKKINSTFSDVNEEICTLKDNHPDLINNDVIKDIISDLFVDNITSPYDNNKLTQIYKEGKERYDKFIPPGYKDFQQKKNSEERSLFGDLIIWFQIIDYAKDISKPIIFVTDDLKEDWWYKFNGKTISPRPELLKEFNDKTDQKILIYNADSFLTFAKEHIGADIDDSILEEIKNLRLKDENYLYMRNLLNHKEKSLSNSDKKKFEKCLFDDFANQDLKEQLNQILFNNVTSKNKKKLFSNYESVKHFSENWDKLDDTEKQMLLSFLSNYSSNHSDDIKHEE